MVTAAGELPSQPSLRRLKQFGVRPNRELGQNFLVDSNLLGVISDAAGLDASDVVLEIGGGLGVLSEHLAEQARHVHVVEVDRGLEVPLRDAVDRFGNVTLHLADAMHLDLAALAPAPAKVVANLPYGIAAPAVLRTIEELDSVTRWVAMAQKEVGERLAASPGSKDYGIPSVLAQLACDVRVIRPVSRSVFFPVPNVDSVLVGLQRRGPAATPAVRALVRAAFAHRRKALARSLALAPGAAPGVRDRAREALGALGHPADVRAERLSPEEFAALAEKLGEDMTELGTVAPGKVNLCLYLGPTREDGYHELLSLVQPVDVFDDVVLGPSAGPYDEVECDGVEGPNLAGRALEAFRAATGWDTPPQRVTVSKRIPVAAGMGGGSSDAAATLRLARSASGVDADLAALGFGIGADVPALLHHELTLVRGAGEQVEPLSALAPFVVAIVPSAEALSTPDVFAEADRLGLGRSADELDELHSRLVEDLGPGSPLPVDLMTNDLEPAAISLCPSIEPVLERMRGSGARAAMVSGSGPTVFGVFEEDPLDFGTERVETLLDGVFDEPVIAAPVVAEAFRLLDEAPEGEVDSW